MMNPQQRTAIQRLRALKDGEHPEEVYGSLHALETQLRADRMFACEYFLSRYTDNQMGELNLDSETLYEKLREVVESMGGFIDDVADEHLSDAARFIAEHPGTEGNDVMVWDE